MTPNTPTACDARHKEVMLAMAKWLAIPILLAVVGINAGFYRAYVEPVEASEVRLRKVEQACAVTISELKAIRAALARMEATQLRLHEDHP